MVDGSWVSSDLNELIESLEFGSLLIGSVVSVVFDNYRLTSIFIG